MARPSRRKQDEGPAGPGEWIVTFSDCMTLLLCFFVMLLTFSSFDEVELQKLAGIFQCQSQDSIFPNPREIKDSAVPPVERVVDTTEEGSETPSASEDRQAGPVGRPIVVLEDEAYRDRKVFFIPSEGLFWGNGTALTRQGRGRLEMIGRFMRMVPCRVVIGENGAAQDARDGEALRLGRAWAVMRFLTDESKLPADRFNITASATAAPTRLKGQRVVAVTLIPRDVY
jgi:hypothetical protein